MLYNNYMRRHDVRLKIIYALYQHLLLQEDINECFLNNFDNLDDFIISLRDDININKEKYINEINNHLNRFSFDRLNYIDQAILLEAISEIKQGINNKNIVIDEAIIFAKEYCDDDAYKYINGVLDNL